MAGGTKRGQFENAGKSRHTGAGSSVNRTKQGTRSSEAGRRQTSPPTDSQIFACRSLGRWQVVQDRGGDATRCRDIAFTGKYLSALCLGPLGGCTHTRINVSASDLRQEPSAVVLHVWDLCGGCRVTGIPIATALDSYIFFARVKSGFDPYP